MGIFHFSNTEIDQESIFVTQINKNKNRIFSLVFSSNYYTLKIAVFTNLKVIFSNLYIMLISLTNKHKNPLSFISTNLVKKILYLNMHTHNNNKKSYLSLIFFQFYQIILFKPCPNHNGLELILHLISLALLSI